MSVDTEKANYGLGYSTAEAQRLIRQNEYLIKVVGYTIHPSLRRQLPNCPKIAEVATGTGAFLITLSKELGSDSQLDGYDISDSAFISGDDFPKNVKLQVLNAKEDPPAELKQQYDAVFVRFMNIAMKPEEWALVGRTALSLLKPGGSLQWFEADFRQMGTPLLENPEASTEALEALTALYRKCAPYDGWCVDNLTRVLSTIGFNHVKRHVMSTDRLLELRHDATGLGIGASSGVVNQAIAKGSTTGLPTKEAFDKMIELAKDEAKHGAYIRIDLVVWVAFKPS